MSRQFSNRYPCRCSCWSSPALPPRRKLPPYLHETTSPRRRLKKAVDLLETISEQVPNLHSASNRIRAECVIADLLWSRDEKRARVLFKTASDDLVTMIANIDFSDQGCSQQLSWLGQQRSEIANRIAMHDPDAAISFVHAIFRHNIRTWRSGAQKWYSDTEHQLGIAAGGMIAAKIPRAVWKSREPRCRGLSYKT